MMKGVVPNRLLNYPTLLNATNYACYLKSTSAICTYSLCTCLIFVNAIPTCRIQTGPYGFGRLNMCMVMSFVNDCVFICFIIFECHNLNMLYKIHASDLRLFIVLVFALFNILFASFILAQHRLKAIMCIMMGVVAGCFSNCIILSMLYNIHNRDLYLFIVRVFGPLSSILPILIWLIYSRKLNA